MSFSETIFLFFLALIIFGPKKLPEIARQVGKFVNEFRRASNEFKAQIEQEIANLEVENRKMILPPSPPVEGTASRALNAVEVEATPGEPVATVAASEESGSGAGNDGTTTPVATEAADEPEAVTSPTSQESHA